jgi:uncharacterized membrane protein YfcA
VWHLPEVWTAALIIAVALAVVLYGFSKTAMPVTGVLAGSILAAALTPAVASGFVVPLLLVGDVIALALYRQHADWLLIRRLIPGVLAGFVITVLLFRFVDSSTLGRILGVLILISVVLEVWRMRAEIGSSAEHPEMENKLAIAFFGTLAGMTTMGANAGGAAMTLYLVKMRVSMLAFMGTATWFFAILNLIKVPFVVGLGLLNWHTMLTSLWFLPALFIGAGVGVVTFRRLNPATFVNIALGLSALAAVWLIVMG